MEKTAKCIKMLRILNTGRIYKVKELADLLETKERNVIDYKEELNFLGDEEGFHIVGIPGKFGGYQLNHTYPIPGFKFTSNEKKALTVKPIAPRPDRPAGWGRRRLRRRHRPDGSWDSRGPPRRTPCPGPAVGPAISKGIPHRRR